MADKFVFFDQYCKVCKYEKNKENEEPCDDCLKQPVNEDSHKPWYFEVEEDK